MPDLKFAVLFNGEPCVMEDIMEMFAADIDLLSHEAAGDFLSSSEESSPSSSEWGFGHAELMEMELPEAADWYREIVLIQRQRTSRAAGD